MKKFKQFIDNLSLGNRQAFAPESEGGAVPKNSNEQAPGGNPLDTSIADLEFSFLDKLPKHEREIAIKELNESLAKKVKNLEKITHGKSEDLSKQLKEINQQRESLKDLITIKEQMDSNPELAKAMSKTYQDVISGRLTTKKDVDKSLKTLDKKIEETNDPEIREQLRSLRDIVKEESSSGEVIERVEKIEKAISSLASIISGVKSDSASKGLSDLRNEFGEEIIEKYQDKLQKNFAKWGRDANESWENYVRYVFKNTLNDLDYETAIFKRKEIKDKREKMRKTNVDPASGDHTSKTVEVKRDKIGRPNVRAWVQDIVASALNR